MLDPDAQTLLDMVREANRPAFDTVSPAEARALYRAGRKVLSPEPPPVAEVRDLTMPGPGGPLALRLFRGKAGDRSPAMVFFHGGGWVVGDIDTHDPMCRHLAWASGGAVVSVDYRLAPEHKFPAAVEDCLAATEWVAANAAALGIDGTRLAVGGDSAGGNLAAAVALLARDRGAPRLCRQVLIYPAVEAAMTHQSYARCGDGYLLTAATMRWFYGHYLRGPADAADWRASPLRVADVAGVVPAYILTAGYDPLSDEGEAYAARLDDAGVPVRLRRYDGQIHGFCQNGKVIHAAFGALGEIADVLKEAWGTT